MKQITQEIRDYLSRGNIQVANLVAMELPSGNGDFMYYTDAPYDIKYAGHTYRTNTILKVSQPRLTKVPSAFDISITVPVSMQGELDKALNSNSLADRKVIVHLAYLNQGEVVPHFTDGTCLQVFKGTYSEYNASVSNGRNVLVWKYSSSFKTLEKVNGRITDDRTHRAMQVNASGYEVPTPATKRIEYMRDTGFQHANKSVSVLAKYQTTETAYKVKSKRAGGLSGLVGGKNVSLVEYQRAVVKEADLRFDLSAKYLPVVYGVQKVGAIPVFADTDVKDPNSVWVVYAICEGEIDGFLDVYLDGKPIIKPTPGDDDTDVIGYKKGSGDTLAGATKPTVHGEQYNYEDGAGKITLWTYHGKSNQQADPNLVEMAKNTRFKLQADNKLPSSYWDSNSRLLDTAYIVAKIEITEDRNNIPSFEVEVQGRKVTKFNKEGIIHANKTSLNFAWQLLDYLTNPVFGGGLTLEDIDIPSFINVAAKLDIIDTSYEVDWVPFWRYIGWTDRSGDNRHIMQGSPILDTAVPVNKNIEGLLSEFDASINMVDGKYVLTVESIEEPVLDISYGDVIEGKVSIKDSNVKDRKNSIEASIIDPAQGWKANTVAFFNSDYKEEDKNVPRKLTAKFNSITNYYTARARAERLLKRNRHNKEITFTIFNTAEFLRPNHVITLTHPILGWDKKKFLLKDINYLDNAKVQVTAVEFVEDVYINSKQSDVSHAQVVDDVKDVLLPPTNLHFTRYSNTKVPYLNGYLAWDKSKSKNISYYTVQMSGSTEIDVVQANSHTRTYNYRLYKLQRGKYTFQVRAKDNYGNSSFAATIDVVITSNLPLPPVENFRVVNSDGKGGFFGKDVELAWDRVESELAGDGSTLYFLNINNPVNGKTISAKMLRDKESYTYTLEDNMKDFKRETGKLGVFRQLSFGIKATSMYGIGSEETII